MIKKYFAALSAIALISVAPFALAASSTDLTVTGLITPNACTPTLSGGGIVDHGKFSAKDLRPDRETPLPSQTLQLAVNCDAATTFKLRGIDHRAASSTDGNGFGLGFINTDQKLGYSELRSIAPMADGVSVVPLHSRDNGSTWFRSAQIDALGVSSYGALGTTTPIAIKDLLTDLKVDTYIARADALDLTNEVALDGLATLEILY
ncbi:DUF1120 domain-containing protein [Pseudomonas sp. GT1P32]